MYIVFAIKKRRKNMKAIKTLTRKKGSKIKNTKMKHGGGRGKERGGGGGEGRRRRKRRRTMMKARTRKTGE